MEDEQEDSARDATPGAVLTASFPATPGAVLTASFPAGRVKKIMKLDREINKITSEALFLVSLSAELFLSSLAERASSAAHRKKRRTIRTEQLLEAVRSHFPTSTFLLDCLEESIPAPAPQRAAGRKRAAAPEKPMPQGARRIDGFFSKSTTDAQH